MSARGLWLLGCCALLGACGKASHSPTGLATGGRGGATSDMAGTAGAGAIAGASAVAGAFGGTVCDPALPSPSRLVMLDGQRLQDNIGSALGAAAPLVDIPAPLLQGMPLGPETITLLHQSAHALALELTSSPTVLAALTGCREDDESAACRDSFIQGFGARAYRRPLTEDDTADLRAAFDSGQKLGENFRNFRSGVRAVVEVTLQGPDFLYLEEPGPGCQ